MGSYAGTNSAGYRYPERRVFLWPGPLCPQKVFVCPVPKSRRYLDSPVSVQKNNCTGQTGKVLADKNPLLPDKIP